jgi:general secretion pathway protein M
MAESRAVMAIEQLRRYQDAAAEFLDKRTARERQMLALMSIAIVLWLLYWGLVAMILSPMEESKRIIAARRSALAQMAILRGEYLGIQAQVGQLESQIRSGQRGNVLSVLETMANEVQIKDKITSMDPKSAPPNDLYRETVIEVRLTNVNLKQLTDYLFRVENSGSFLKIKRLRIKTRTDDPGYLDVNFRVSSFEPIGPARAPRPAVPPAAPNVTGRR